MLRRILWSIATTATFALCLVVPYPLGTKAWANGLPLPYVIWEQLENGAWVDFVGGCVSVVALPVDLAVATAISVFAWRQLKRRFPARSHFHDPPPAASDQPV